MTNVAASKTSATFASETTATLDETFSYVMQGIAIHPHVSFGTSYLIDSQIAEALGYNLLSHFHQLVKCAQLYRMAMRDMLILTEQGYKPVKAFTLSGVQQLCLYVKATGNPQRAARASELLDGVICMKSLKRVAQ